MFQRQVTLTCNGAQNDEIFPPASSRIHCFVCNLFLTSGRKKCGFLPSHRAPYRLLQFAVSALNYLLTGT